MGKIKKRGKKKKGASNSVPGSKTLITLRQEKTGKIKPKPFNNAKPYSNLDHLEKLACWASGQASIPSLAAFFGQRLAATAESLGVVPDPSLFLCQRCETVLQPGSNCSVRIEKNNVKRRRRRNKSKILTQNNVVYFCHYCSCRNFKRGTPKGYMKVLCPSNSKAFKQSKSKESGSDENRMEDKDANSKECETLAVQKTTEILVVDAPAVPPLRTGQSLTIDAPANPPSRTGEIPTIDAPEIHPSRIGEIPTIDAPATPPAKPVTTLLNLKKRKRNKSTSKKQTEPEKSSAPVDGEKTVSLSKRQRRKMRTWTSLKEIATNELSGKQDVTFAIPFSLEGTS